MPDEPVIRTDFPGGSGIDFEVGSRDGRTGIAFAADPRGGCEQLWFHWRAEEVEGTEVLAALKHLDACLGSTAKWTNHRPVVRGPDGWQRAESVEVEELPDGQHWAIWSVPVIDSAAETALCYPYQRPELELLVDDCPDLRCDCIGHSQAGRRLLRLATDYGQVGDPRPGVYLTARQHAGETPGGWVLDGLWRWLGDHKAARKAALWWAVPMVAVDEVVTGCYGKDPHPIDCNRAWTRPSMRNEVRTLQLDMHRWAARCRPGLVVDLHAPGAGESQNYTFLSPIDWMAPTHAPIRRLAELYERHKPEPLRSADPVRVAGYPSRWHKEGTIGAWVWRTFGIVGACFETAYAMSGEHVMDVDDYRRLGASLGAAILDYLKR